MTKAEKRAQKLAAKAAMSQNMNVNSTNDSNIDVVESNEEVIPSVEPSADLTQVSQTVAQLDNLTMEGMTDIIEADLTRAAADEDELSRSDENEADSPIDIIESKSDDVPKVTKVVKNQTYLIRKAIFLGKERDLVLRALAIFAQKNAGWAKARLALYERAYGKMGVNDPYKLTAVE